MERERSVLVAMSGGVDSSAAAAALLEEGFGVVGVTFRMWEEGLLAPSGPLSCETAFDLEGARECARALGIEHMELDLSEPFLSRVVEPFAAEYLRGRTPNPCVECNRRVRFPALLEAARESGTSYIATGHYARIGRGEDGGYVLMRAGELTKDQSYVLYGLGREELRLCLFPNGDRSKSEVRRAAAEAGIAQGRDRESQDICFLCGGDYRDFLSLRYPEALSPGPILDTSGRVLGEHEGIAFYTVGQRRGLGVSESRPLYVVALDPERRAVVLGGREEVPGVYLLAQDAIWSGGSAPGPAFDAGAMVRYNSEPAPCRVEVGNGGFEVFFRERVEALSPGQHAVLYRGDVVLGGGVIAAVG